MNDDTTQKPDLTRRVVLRGAAVAGLTVPVLAACASDSEGEAATAPPDGASPESSEGNGGGGGGTTVSTSDVPVGGGTILGQQEVVVTQPTEGEFMAFSAVCTHQGCLVQSISDGTINCPCHGSAFSVEDGSVVNGPAQSPLESRSVTVEDDQVVVG
jgi:Rieske Fe-S protein